MRLSSAIPVLMLLLMPAFAEPRAVDPSATDPSAAAADRNDARWAELEAQARITDGDYDGAVQAEQQANADRHNADRHELMARPSPR